MPKKANRTIIHNRNIKLNKQDNKYVIRRLLNNIFGVIKQMKQYHLA